MPRRKVLNGLTVQQRRFVEEYLIDLNATAAYKRAGYKGTGKTAENNASRLLGYAGVQQAIADAQKAHTRKAGLTADVALRELLAILTSNVTHYTLDASGKLVLTPDASPDAMQAVSHVRYKRRTYPSGVTEVESEVRLWSKTDALRTAMQHLGLLKNIHEHRGANGGPIELLTREQRTVRIVELVELVRIGTRQPDGHTAGRAADRVYPPAGEGGSGAGEG